MNDEKVRNNNSRRSGIEIISHILKIANAERHGVKQTRIMYRASLSYEQLKRYMKILTDNDMLRYDKETKTFNVTEKGLNALKVYSELGHIMTEKGQQEEQVQTTTTTTMTTSARL